MDTRTKLLIGTSKGLVEFHQQDDQWQIHKVHFEGLPVSMIYKDERNGNWWAGLSHKHWGQKLQFSEDQGNNWQQVPTPKYPGDAKLLSGKKATLKKIWCMAHGGPDHPESLWMGTEPGGLFYSSDNGQQFELVPSLWEHPSRTEQHQWFGAGKDYPFIHSIVLDPRDSNHLYIAVSCAGVFESKDSGLSWAPKNKGLIAAYLPNPQAEVGHDPHLVLACQANPDVLWQQNHCGIFRSTDGGGNWTMLSHPDRIPHYGFALGIDHQNPNRAWVIPALSDEIRVAPDLALRVYRTEDAGQTWRALHEGLPQKNAFDIVFRHALAVKDNTLVFGTTTGNVYYSNDGGDHWTCLTNNFARVESVIFG